MSLTLDDVAFLQSPRGQQLLSKLRHEDLSDRNTLALVTKLRKSHSQADVNAALTMARLRVRAVEKFGDMAGDMLFTDDALQQASDPLVRRYRAERFAGSGRILDVCCGIGADSLAYATVSDAVLGLDIDPVRIAIAQHNAKVMGFNHLTFQQQDVNDGIPPDYEVIFFDPGRRDLKGKRLFDVEQYIPPLSLVRDWRAGTIAVKLSPGVDAGQLSNYDGQLEFISVGGDLKEAVLWLDERSHPNATLLFEGVSLHWNEEPSTESAPTSEPMRWLVEPDPALIRAGLVANAARYFDGHQLDANIAYFTCAERPTSPWVRAWKVLDWMPFHLKRLRRYLAERQVGMVTVKKRGSPITPEQLQSQLKLKGDNSLTLVLTKLDRQPVVLICADYVPQQVL